MPDNTATISRILDRLKRSCVKQVATSDEYHDRLGKAVGDGVERMRRSTTSKDECAQELRRPDSAAATQWLQSGDAESRQLFPHAAPHPPQCVCLADASIAYIAEAWPNLQPHIREAIFTLIDGSLSQQQWEREPS